MGMILILVETEHHPDDKEEARAVVLDVARASRFEPACLAYNVAIDCENAAVTRVSELWASASEHAQHMEQPHVAAFFDRIKSFRVVRRNFRMFEIGRELELKLPING